MADGTNTQKIYDELKKLIAGSDHSVFLEGLMTAYGFSMESITQTLNGTADISKVPDRIDRRRDFVFQEVRAGIDDEERQGAPDEHCKGSQPELVSVLQACCR